MVPAKPLPPTSKTAELCTTTWGPMQEKGPACLWMSAALALPPASRSTCYQSMVSTHVALTAHCP